jgi:hypothetical protein
MIAANAKASSGNANLQRQLVSTLDDIGARASVVFEDGSAADRPLGADAG